MECHGRMRATLMSRQEDGLKSFSGVGQGNAGGEEIRFLFDCLKKRVKNHSCSYLYCYCKTNRVSMVSRLY